LTARVEGTRSHSDRHTTLSNTTIGRFERFTLTRYCHIQRREVMTPVDHTLDRRAKRKYFLIMILTALEQLARKLTENTSPWRL
jgi:hypothetical protein